MRSRPAVVHCEGFDPRENYVLAYLCAQPGKARDENTGIHHAGHGRDAVDVQLARVLVEARLGHEVLLPVGATHSYEAGRLLRSTNTGQAAGPRRHQRRLGSRGGRGGRHLALALHLSRGRRGERLLFFSL